MSSFIDLHIHSKYSDGSLSPKEILDIADKTNISMISITDHDTIDNLKDLKLEIHNFQNIKCVPAVEISSFFIDRKQEKKLIHILGYGIDEDNEDLMTLLEYLKNSRTKINEEYIKNLLFTFKQLEESDLYDVDCSRYFRLAREIIRQLSIAGVDEELIIDVKRHCRKELPQYVNYDIEASEVIKAINKAGGIAVIAHPTIYKLRDIEIKRMIKQLIGYGIEGIETNYSEMTKDEMEKLNMMAKSYGLLSSVGSDFHFFSENNPKEIGFGIDNNLCFEQCSMSEHILKKSLYIGGGRR